MDKPFKFLPPKELDKLSEKEKAEYRDTLIHHRRENGEMIVRGLKQAITYERWLEEVDKLLEKILAVAPKEAFTIDLPQFSREYVEKMLKKWLLRIKFLNALDEEKEIQKEKNH